jgi:PII-like signaling protein
VDTLLVVEVVVFIKEELVHLADLVEVEQVLPHQEMELQELPIVVEVVEAQAEMDQSQMAVREVLVSSSSVT